MRTKTSAALAALGTLVLAAAALAGGSLAPTPAQASPGATLSLDVAFQNFFLLDFGPTGVRQVTSFQDPFDPSRGDQTMFHDRLLRRGAVVGHGSGQCTITDVVPADGPENALKLICQVSYQLPEGQIATQGSATNNPVKRLAITGGTGRYVGARGEAVLTEFGNGTGSVVFRFARAGG